MQWWASDDKTKAALTGVDFAVNENCDRDVAEAVDHDGPSDEEEREQGLEPEHCTVVGGGIILGPVVGGVVGGQREVVGRERVKRGWNAEHWGRR